MAGKGCHRRRIDVQREEITDTLLAKRGRKCKPSATNPSRHSTRQGPTRAPSRRPDRLMNVSARGATDKRERERERAVGERVEGAEMAMCLFPLVDATTRQEKRAKGVERGGRERERERERVGKETIPN